MDAGWCLGNASSARQCGCVGSGSGDAVDRSLRIYRSWDSELDTFLAYLLDSGNILSAQISFCR